MQKGQLSGRWTRKRLAKPGAPHSHSNVPLAVPLLHGDECGWDKATRARTLPSSSLRSLVLQLGGSCCSTRQDRAVSTTHTMLLLWYHGWYHGMSRTGCSGCAGGRHGSRIVPAGCSETWIMTLGIWPCIILAIIARPARQLYKTRPSATRRGTKHSARVMHPLYRPHWLARHASHDQTGGGWTVSLLPCARCTQTRVASWAPP